MDKIDEISLNSRQISGLNLIVETLKKKFPFVKNWKLNESHKLYRSAIYIDLYINWEELSKYSGYQMKPLYKEIYDDRYNMLTTSSLGVFMGNEDIEPLDEDKFNHFYNIKESMNRHLNNMYESLPKELQSYYEYKNYGDILRKPTADEFLDYRLF